MANEGRVVMVRGRIVWVAGDLFKGQIKTIFGTQQPKLNAQTGEKEMQFGMGLSVSKQDLQTPGIGAELWVAIHEEAWSLYPSRQIPPSFAMKYKDGDGVDDQGRPFALREGYQNACVFALTTQLPIRYFKWENGANTQIADGIKCGDYVEVQVMVKAHGAVGQGKPGLYLNPLAVRLQAPGKEIINAPSGDQVFGVAAPSTPQNYVAPPPPPAFNPPAPGGAQPHAPPPPHYDVLPPTHQPPPGGAPVYPSQPVHAHPAAPPSMPTAPTYPAQPHAPSAYPSNGLPPPPGAR
jgi:hypothetical protein